MWSRFLIIGLLALASPALASPALAGGCTSDDSELAATDDPNKDSMGAPNEENPDGAGAGGCQLASDCVLAASTCCECPSFAVPAGGGYDAGCEDVDCGASGLCSAVEAVCEQGQCLMICSPIVTDQVCAFGFEADEAGCLLNQCAASPRDQVPECEVDTDCVQIPADCCGCSRGGADTAVALGQAESDVGFLNCPVDPACPGINVCNLDEVAQCIAGSCTLAAVAGGALDPQEPPADGDLLCGTPDLPDCARGHSCVLNEVSANDAAALSVGTCVQD